ncbi:cytochrome P450 6a2-like [Uranotaenia lowii]|uniref:cytochrome P450 6a2-like n=1 Tax=Uranotaenia lowii TaxID=190385 RepID=UPI0024784C56|nr:cytochrome P450 6a2-like [Uranotaenia lowii]
MGLVGLVLLLLLGSLTVVYLYLRSKQTFWKRRNIPAAGNPHLLYGNVSDWIKLKEHSAVAQQRIYRDLRRKGLTFGGFNNLFTPSILLADPELVKHILVKDFNVFQDRGLYVDPEVDPLNANLFNLEGLQWKVMRQKLSPTFTSGKMKMMYDIVVGVADEMNKFMEVNYHRKDLDIRDVLQRFTTDVIGNVAFGIECNTMQNPDSDFRKMGCKAFQFTTWNLMKTFVAMQYRGLAKTLKIKLMEDDVERFFLDITKSTVKLREQSNVQRNDFLKLLLEIKNQGKLSDDPNSGGEGLSMRELAAQCFVFFLAGFETSSTTMNFCLYELAKNPDVQDQLRKEINQALTQDNGNIKYDTLMGMDYLDRVVNETLRMPDSEWLSER